MAQEIDI